MSPSKGLALSRAFIFYPVATQPHTSVYSVFCRVNAIIPPTPQNSIQGFTAAFPAIVPTQPPAIPDKHNKPLHRLRHAGGHTRARARSVYTRYHRHTGTLYRSAQAVYYNKVYKMADYASGGGSAPTVCGLLASADMLSVWQGIARRGFGASWHRD